METKNEYIKRCTDEGRTESKCTSMWETMERNQYFKDVIARLRELKKKKKKC